MSQGRNNISNKAVTRHCIVLEVGFTGDNCLELQARRSAGAKNAGQERSEEGISDAAVRSWFALVGSHAALRSFGHAYKSGDEIPAVQASKQRPSPVLYVLS